MEKPVRFSRSARRHRIGRRHVWFVLEHYEAEIINGQYVWVGVDDRGVELEIVAVERPDVLLVIHVMPRQFRSRN